MKWYLKKSYIQEGINLYLIRFLLWLNRSKYKGEGKVLVKSADGIGDLIIRTKLVEKIFEKYGKENVYLLIREQYVELGKILGYENIISYSRKERKHFFQRLRKMKELNMMGFSEYIDIEFVNDVTVGNLFIDERIGVLENCRDKKRYNRYYTKGYFLDECKTVLEEVEKSYKEIFDEEIVKRELIPDLRDLYSVSEENIVIAVGASDKERIISVEKMGEFIKKIIDYEPNRKVVLLGKGDSEKRYSDRLMEILEGENIENLVGKFTLDESFKEISKAKLFVGFDSGMFNFAFAQRRDTILIANGLSDRFYHKVPWVKILTPKNILENLDNTVYNNKVIDNITIEEFEKVLSEIRWERLQV